MILSGAKRSVGDIYVPHGRRNAKPHASGAVVTVPTVKP
jgi:hypothetical protein